MSILMMSDELLDKIDLSTLNKDDAFDAGVKLIIGNKAYTIEVTPLEVVFDESGMLVCAIGKLPYDRIEMLVEGFSIDRVGFLLSKNGKTIWATLKAKEISLHMNFDELEIKLTILVGVE